jgi:hypothetical protein
MNINEQSTNRPLETVRSKYASFVPMEEWPLRVSESCRRSLRHGVLADSVANWYTDVP